jgi:tetratricopeptide (TPR) repeat protein
MRNLTGWLLIVSFLAAIGLLYAGDLEEANEYFLTGQYGKAITSYERALATAENKAQIYYNLGVCHERLGNLERALSYYRRAGNTKDAPASAARLESRIKEGKISRLKQEAQQAYDAMNYGVASNKAKAILELDPDNSWAQSFLAALSEETAPALEPETTGLAPESLAAETAAAIQPEAVPAEPEAPSPVPLPGLFIIIGAAVVLAVAVAAFFIGRATKKQTAERALRTVIRLLPAGMFSVRGKNKLSLLFFEHGEVIKAVVEKEGGERLEGFEAAEEFLGNPPPYNDKGKGPWNKFAELMIDVYHRARGEAEKPAKPTTKSKRKGGKK